MSRSLDEMMLLQAAMLVTLGYAKAGPIHAVGTLADEWMQRIEVRGRMDDYKYEREHEEAFWEQVMLLAEEKLKEIRGKR